MGLGQPEKTSEGVEGSGMSSSEWPLGPVSDPRRSGCRSQLQKVWEPTWCPGDTRLCWVREMGPGPTAAWGTAPAGLQEHSSISDLSVETSGISDCQHGRESHQQCFPTGMEVCPEKKAIDN